MSVTSWLRNRKIRPICGSAFAGPLSGRRKLFRPRLELLEDRVEPAAWVSMPAPAEANPYFLRGIWGDNGHGVFAVGSARTILHFDGTAWTAQGVLDPTTNTISYQDPSVNLIGVWGTVSSGQLDVFAVGQQGTVAGQKIYHYSSTDAVWQQMTAPSPTSGGLLGLWGTSATDVYAVGQGGTVLHYDGTAWTTLLTHIPSGTLYRIWGNPATSDLVVAASVGAFHSTDRGVTWQAINLVPNSVNITPGVWGINSGDVFVAGAAQNPGASALIAHSSDSGATWPQAWTTPAGSLPPSPFLIGVAGRNAQDVFAVGGSGVSLTTASILHYDGTSWTAQAPGTSNELLDVWAGGPYTFAVGVNQTILTLQQTAAFDSLSGPTIVAGTASATLSGHISAVGYAPLGSVQVLVNGVTQDAAIDPATGNFSSVFPTAGLTASGSPYPITYSYAGDATISSATDTSQSLTVVTPTNTTLTSSVEPSVYGQSVSITATVTATEPGSSTPTGSVQFQLDGSNFGSPVALVNGTASLTTATLASGPHTVTAAYGGGDGFQPSGSGPLTETVNPMTTANLQAELSLTGGMVTIVASSQDAANTIVAAVNGLPAHSSPVSVVVNLGGDTFTDLNASPPAGVTLVINGNGTTTTIVGHSPALTVSSGIVVVSGVTFTDDTAAPAILVKGGLLTLRHDTVQASSSSPAAMSVSGGTVDLGTATDAGGNTISVTGSSVAISNATTTQITAVGDTFTVNGVALTGPAAFADAYAAQVNQPLTVPGLGVLSNDIDPNGSLLTAVLAAAPAHGTVVLNAGGSFVYSPASNFAGTDRFTYEVRTAGGTLSNPATVTVSVSGVKWINPAGGDWDVAANWQDAITGANRVPTAADDAVIDLGANNFTVTHSGSNDVVNSLTDQAPFTLSGGSLDLTAASTFRGGLSVSGGGVLGGPGDVTVNGEFDGNGGTVGGGGVLYLNGPSEIAYSFSFGRSVVNAGNLLLYAAGGVDFAPSAGFTNAPTGTVDFQITNFTFGSGPGGTFVNQGLITQTDFGGNHATLNMTFDNQAGGRVHWVAGSLAFAQAATIDGTPGATTLAGDAGTTFNFAGPTALGATASVDASAVAFSGTTAVAGPYHTSRLTALSAAQVTFTGSVSLATSTLDIENGSTAELPAGPLALAGLVINQSTLTVPADVTVNGEFDGNGGTVGGSGVLYLNGPSEVDYGFTFNRPVVNAGHFVLSPYGNTDFGPGTDFTNGPAGTVDFQINSVGFTFGSGTGTFFNQGLLTSSPGLGGGTAFLNMILVNSGIVRFAVGTLNLGGGYVQAPGGTVSGSFTGEVTNPTELQLSPAPPPTFSTYTQTVSGRLVEQIGGFAAGTQYGQIVITNDVNLAGSLSVLLINGFTPHVPDIGRQFTVIDNQGSNPVHGTFAGLAEGQLLWAGSYGFTISYVGGTGSNDVVLTLTVVNRPPIAVAGGPYTIAEGGPLTLDASLSSDPDGDPLTYSWDVNGDGVFGDATGVNPTLTWAQLMALGINDGPHSNAVRVRVSDGIATVDSDPATSLTINNTPPSGTLGNNGPVREGSSTTVSFSNASDPSSADAAAGFHYSFALSPSGLAGTYAAAGTASSASFTFADNGSYTVYGRISDKDNGYSDYQTTVAVTNVAPANVALTLSAVSINEGQSVTLGGSFTDPGTLDTHSVAINWGDGSTGTMVNLAAGVLTFTGVTHQYLDNPVGLPNGSFPISVTVTDKDGGAGAGGTSVQVKNVPPTADLSGPLNGVPGQPRTFTFSALDPSPTDQSAGFSYTINWGDGTPQNPPNPDVQTISRLAGNGSGVAVDHIYTTTGSYMVQVTATDKDGGTSGPVTQTVTVQVVQMQGADLAVGGTTGTDSISISPANPAGDLAVTVNKVTYLTYLASGTPVALHPTGHILVYAQAGVNDIVQIVSSKIQGTTYFVTVPAVLYGQGDGDTLDASGSTANNAFFGGDGNDNLLAGSGRNLMVGGGGSDKISAINAGDSILIGGTTDYDLENTALTYDQKLAAVYAIMAEWGRTDLTGTALQQYQARVAHLTSGGGLNGTWLLNATTMHDDGAADTLTGSAVAFDWFVAGPSSQDNLKNWRTGEVITNVS
jgi:hypothetical protein